MPKIRSGNTWFSIQDVVTREDGQLMSFKLNTKEHGFVTVDANVPWKEWEAFITFLGRSAGGATVGFAFGPVGALLGAAAGVVAFFKSYDAHAPGYVHRGSGTHYFEEFFNTRNRSAYQP